VNLCVTHFVMMHLTLTCELRGSWILQRILDSLRMMKVACYLVFVSCTFRLWFRQRNSIILWHTGINRLIAEQRGYGVKIMNRRYMRQNQITCNGCHSWVGLGPIYPNRVYFVTYLSWQCALLCLILKMAQYRRAMYDGFNEMSGHSTEWVQIVKDFLN
jgi:hypothetical protein